MNEFFKSQKESMLEYKSVKRKLTFIEIFFIFISVVIVGIFIYPIFRYRHYEERPVTCTGNQRHIALSLQMYVQDHEELLPESSSIWHVIMVEPPVLICPEAKKTKNGYLYNNNLSGVSLGKIANPKKQMATVDGKTTITPNRSIDNIYYTPSDVLFRHYEKEKNMYWTVASYLDGHVEIINKVTEPESWDKPAVKTKPGVKK